MAVPSQPQSALKTRTTGRLAACNRALDILTASLKADKTRSWPTTLFVPSVFKFSTYNGWQGEGMRTWTSLSLSVTRSSYIPATSAAALSLGSLPCKSGKIANWSWEAFSQSPIRRATVNSRLASSNCFFKSSSPPVSLPKPSLTLPSLSSSPPTPQSSSARRWRRLRHFVGALVQLGELWGILGWILVRGGGRKMLRLRGGWFSLGGNGRGCTELRLE